jgi:hypothetical protein
VEGLRIDVFPGISGAHLEQDAAHADAHDGAGLEQFEADGIDLCLGPLGAFQTKPSQCFDQGLIQSGEVKADLIGLHFIGREPVGEQAHLLHDAILHLSPRAVELLVQLLRGPGLSRQWSHHEARVFSLVEVFGLGHNATQTGPALVRLIGELGEEAHRLAGALVQHVRLMVHALPSMLIPKSLFTIF